MTRVGETNRWYGTKVCLWQAVGSRYPALLNMVVQQECRTQLYGGIRMDPKQIQERGSCINRLTCKMSLSLSVSPTIFQGKMELLWNSAWNYRGTLKAASEHIFTSKLNCICLLILKVLVQRITVILMWVPDHWECDGQRNLLAKKGVQLRSVDQNRCVVLPKAK